MNVRRSGVFASALPVVLAASFLATIRPHACTIYTPPATRLDQGCINQGNDRRIAASLVCWAQRRLSWKSEREPHLSIIGEPQAAHAVIAWPPYCAVNFPDGSGHWRVFRAGFRYDRNWRGYIFPTAAWKCLPDPMRY